MLVEPKQQDSGVPQGAFLKRHAVLNENNAGNPFMPEDFRVGDEVTVYGRQIRLTGCDDYTREFFNVSQDSSFLFFQLICENTNCSDSKRFLNLNY
jgi:hypothetical protein